MSLLAIRYYNETWYMVSDTTPREGEQIEMVRPADDRKYTFVVDRVRHIACGRSSETYEPQAKHHLYCTQLFCSVAHE